MNIAETILRKHDDGVFRSALQEVKSEGINTYSFGGLDYLSDKFATVLSESGISQGDTVAVMLAQSAAFAVAHLAILKMGAIVLPVSFTAEQSLIERILKESGAKSLIIDESIQQRFINLISESLKLESIFVASDLVSRKSFGEGFRSFWYEVNFADSDFATVEACETTPAYIFFEPIRDEQVEKSLINHNELLEVVNDLALLDSMQEPKVYWTTQDWASMQIISEMLFRSWYQGNAIASYYKKFRGEEEAIRVFNNLGYRELKSIANLES